MPKFRKKPVVVEAFRMGIDPIPDWFMNEVSKNKIILRSTMPENVHIECRDQFETFCEIETLEGKMTGNYGDFIIQGVEGEIYPCKPAFAATREIGSNQDYSSVVTASAIGAKSQEIQLWLEKQTGIQSFVIFDDDPIYISKAHEHHAVIVDPEKGLTKEDADHALIILSLPLPDKIPDFYEDFLLHRRNTSANPTK